jgi:hypothetical protein
LFTLAGKPVAIEHFVVKRLALGDWIFGDAEVVVPYRAFAQGRNYDGLIGRNALSAFNLIFDYQHRLLWFKPIDTGGKQKIEARSYAAGSAYCNPAPGLYLFTALFSPR